MHNKHEEEELRARGDDLYGLIWALLELTTRRAMEEFQALAVVAIVAFAAAPLQISRQTRSCFSAHHVAAATCLHDKFVLLHVMCYAQDAYCIT